MQDKIKYLGTFMLICMICICSGRVVQGYTGSGTKASPYIVTKESEIREILTKKGSSSWKYIAVNNTITLKNSITISSGKFRLYAKGANRTLKRSGDTSDVINTQSSPKFCFLVKENAEVVFGYKEESKYVLKLGGNKSYFAGNKKCSGFLYIGSGATATIDEKALLTNVKNNKSDQGGTAIFSTGTLTINGEISNCEGTDGGAVGSKKGKVFINSTANIHDCTSKTEGGGIFGMSGCYIEMTGGTINRCTAAEEGGGIFVSGASTCKISAGKITNNTSGLTGGGVFAGGGVTLTIGKTDGTGPHIANNSAGTIGGGIRCNGNAGSNGGGTSYFYGGSIIGNAADNTGGLSCGSGKGAETSKINIKNMHIENNTAKEGIGGMSLPSNVVGTSSKEVYITNCTIQGNSAEKDCGGLRLDCSVVVSNSIFTKNHSKRNGGGIYIGSGILQMNSGTVSNNKSDGNGEGIYVAGQFKIKDSANIEEDNEVYLTKGTYIDVIGRLSKTSGLIAKINSAVNINGTKLVRVGYNGGTSGGELYYSVPQNTKRYSCISMAKTQLLRPSENVKGYENNWIIISEKYQIRYEKNTDEEVTNMPETQEKYWNENIRLSKKQVTRDGYILEKEKHWNSKADGKGKAYVPESIYDENSSITLFAIWKKIVIKEIYINTVDRYYVINQKIVLDKKELLKKVTTDDDLHTGNQYELRVTKINKIDNSNIAKGNNIATENYMNTNEVNQYMLTLEAEDEITKVKASAKMYVYVLSTDLSNGQVRFISYAYLDTLDNTSKWNKRLKNQLITSLSKGENSVYSIRVSYEEIKEIKNKIKSKNYKISNGMNKSVVERLDI